MQVITKQVTTQVGTKAQRHKITKGKVKRTPAIVRYPMWCPICRLHRQEGSKFLSFDKLRAD